MQRFFGVFLMSALTFSVVGCGDAPEGPKNTVPPAKADKVTIDKKGKEKIMPVDEAPKAP